MGDLLIELIVGFLYFNLTFIYLVICTTNLGFLSHVCCQSNHPHWTNTSIPNAWPTQVHLQLSRTLRKLILIFTVTLITIMSLPSHHLFSIVRFLMFYLSQYLIKFDKKLLIQFLMKEILSFDLVTSFLLNFI